MVRTLFWFEAPDRGSLPVDEAGVYFDHVPIFAGKKVLDENGKNGDANGAVIMALIEANALFAKGKLRHQYPHSWRLKPRYF